MAQIETALHFLGPELMDLQLNGVSATRDGNRSRFFRATRAYLCDEGGSMVCDCYRYRDAMGEPLCGDG